MSAWTHVSAVFRIDGIISGDMLYGTSINGVRDPKWDEVVGRTIYEPADYVHMDDYDAQRLDEDWRDYRKRPSRFVPTGSEGSLRRLVWRNPNTHHMAAWTVTVFGDLRDYTDFDAVEQWFRDVCRRCRIRQAVCQMTDGCNQRVLSCDFGGEVRVL